MNINLDYAMFANDNNDVEVIKNSLVDITLASLYNEYGKTVLVSEFKMDNY